jgi:hypothetical protein
MKLLKQRTDAENLGRYEFNPEGAKNVIGKNLPDTEENRAKAHKKIIDEGKRGKWRIVYDDGTHDDVFVFGRNKE